MTKVTLGNVNYFPKDDYYIVGDNSTVRSGITSQTYSGEITILEKVNNKNVKEIGYNSFAWCQGITKVTIYAKLTRINPYAFCDCKSIEYINIPETVTFIGSYALALAGGSSKVVSTSIVIEFNEGRNQKVYIDDSGFSYRTNFIIIYPSNIEPLYNANNQFYGVSTATICAHSSFSFCGKFMTETNMSKCPAQIFKEPLKGVISIIMNKIIGAQVFGRSLMITTTENKTSVKQKISGVLKKLFKRKKSKK